MAPNQLGDHFYITIVSGKVVFTFKKWLRKQIPQNVLLHHGISHGYMAIWSFFYHFQTQPHLFQKPGGRIDGLLFILISLETKVLVAAHADAQLRLETATCSPKERWDSPIIYTSYHITLHIYMYVYSYYKNQHIQYIYISYNVSYELHYFSSVAMLIVVSSLWNVTTTGMICRLRASFQSSSNSSRFPRRNSDDLQLTDGLKTWIIVPGCIWGWVKTQSPWWTSK